MLELKRTRTRTISLETNNTEFVHQNCHIHKHTPNLKRLKKILASLVPTTTSELQNKLRCSLLGPVVVSIGWVQYFTL